MHIIEYQIKKIEKINIRFSIIKRAGNYFIVKSYNGVAVEWVHLP